MAWIDGIMHTGLTGDPDMESLTSTASTNTVTSSRISMPMNAANKKSLLVLNNVFGNGSGGTGGQLVVGGAGALCIGAVGGWISIDANPSAQAGLLCWGGLQEPDSKPTLAIGTDGTIKFLNPTTGAVLASSTTAISTTAASPTKFVAFFDLLTLSTVWISLFITSAGGSTYVEEVALNTGLAPNIFYDWPVQFFGDWTASASHFSMTLTAQHAFCRKTTSTADAPYNVAFPALLGVGATVPNANGASTAWNANTAVSISGGTANWNQVLTNDGVTSIWGDNQTSPATAHDQLCKDATALLGGSETIAWVQNKNVAALTGSGKQGYVPILRRGGTTYLHDWSTSAFGPVSSLSYLGQAGRWTLNPATGVAWVTSEFGAGANEIGGRTLAVVGPSEGSAITKVCGIEVIHSTANLPLAQNPKSLATLMLHKPNLPFHEAEFAPRVGVHNIGLFAQPAVVVAGGRVQGYII